MRLEGEGQKLLQEKKVPRGSWEGRGGWNRSEEDALGTEGEEEGIPSRQELSPLEGSCQGSPTTFLDVCPRYRAVPTSGNRNKRGLRRLLKVCDHCAHSARG